MQTPSEKRNLFALTLTYIKPLTEIDRLRDGHRAYLTRYYDQGVFLVSGAQEPRKGGFILARAGNKAELERLIQDDPFLSEGAAQYTIVEFRPTTFAPGLENLLK